MTGFKRRSSNHSIATLWEFFQYGKFNFDPEYQRNGDVWNEDKQSFLIDSIIKNFPLPPIFLNEQIDEETGNTKYDVIDGKQRLQSIFKFIKGELSLPDDCSSDGFVPSDVDGKKFEELSAPPLIELKRSFWAYQITVEYVDSDDGLVIDNIFDRLNRNGEPLTPQELRNAKYHNNENYRSIEQLPNYDLLKPYLCRLDANRKEDVEFCSELLFTILESGIIDSNRKQLDALYEKYCKDNSYNEEVYDACSIFSQVVSCFKDVVAEFTKYYVYSVSHLYAIWCLAWQCHVQGGSKEDVSKKIPTFYEELKSKSPDVNIQRYIESMKQATKTSQARRSRVNSLLSYMGLAEI